MIPATREDATAAATVPTVIRSPDTGRPREHGERGRQVDCSLTGPPAGARPAPALKGLSERHLKGEVQWAGSSCDPTTDTPHSILVVFSSISTRR